MSIALPDTLPWPKVQMRDVCTLHYGKALTASKRRPGNIPVYGSNGVTGWHDTALKSGPTVMLGRKGQGPLGVKWCEGPFWVIDTAYYTSFSNAVLPRFFYYFTNLMGLNHLKDGTSNPSLTRDVFSFQDFPLPPVQEQAEIVCILETLDDKIELNRKTAATLEEMARALYRSWFVDFDPVHAKAAGRAPAHMDAATAALFPDSFGEDGLPDGWEMGSVEEVFNVVMGQSPPGNTYNESGEGLPFFQGRTDFGFRFPTRRKYCTAPTRIAPWDSILLSVRAPVGDLNRAWEECCIGRGVASLSEKSGRSAYGYEAIWALSEDLKSYDSEGTVFGSINKKQLAGLEIVVPSEPLKDAYEAEAVAIDARVRNITAEIQTLAALRDTLLPRLMSGELRVCEAREQVEEMV
ncbi:restriction endonuclease subunit S [Parasulfitobacter algicola]|uniref:Restriction endonuclease subunit S n=1 Tax=Parasulfitobacter algicola TaxID=2614809 RepID=A0ABX2IMS4_9RHOB|nr:restriction endonuclease subunit S [Sulfitobacter algicola]NSX53276.1 restriction endonuclease subunit S [Sulfitobacter algicola]